MHYGAHWNCNEWFLEIWNIFISYLFTKTENSMRFYQCLFWSIIFQETWWDFIFFSGIPKCVEMTHSKRSNYWSKWLHYQEVKNIFGLVILWLRYKWYLSHYAPTSHTFNVIVLWHIFFFQWNSEFFMNKFYDPFKYWQID